MKEIITSRVVPSRNRVAFLPRKFLGSCHYLRLESFVYGYAQKLIIDYQGGYWEFVDLSNGGLYMLCGDESVTVSCENHFCNNVSANASGIIATLYALCSLTARTQSDHIYSLYEKLLDYAETHNECKLIFAAID